MPLVTGNLSVRNLAADLLVTVLHHPQDVMRETTAIAKRAQTLGMPDSGEEWDVLTAVAASLREFSARGDQRQPAAEIHLLRHLAARRQ